MDPCPVDLIAKVGDSRCIRFCVWQVGTLDEPRTNQPSGILRWDQCFKKLTKRGDACKKTMLSGKSVPATRN